MRFERCFVGRGEGKGIEGEGEGERGDRFGPTVEEIWMGAAQY